MSNYDIKYTGNPNAIPNGATKIESNLNNIGSVYIIQHNDRTDVYLNYSLGIKIEKPTILRLEESNGKVDIDVRRPDKGVVNKVNHHCFKIEFDKKIESVHLMEFI